MQNILQLIFSKGKKINTSRKTLPIKKIANLMEKASIKRKTFRAEYTHSLTLS